MSDGTPSLRFLDGQSLKETGRVTVRDSGLPVKDLNELEMIGDAVFANIWMTPRIVRIDPKTGAVTGHLDLDRIMDIRVIDQGGGNLNVLVGSMKVITTMSHSGR